MLRKLYYLLPVRLRFLSRRLLFFLPDLLRSKKGLLPPRRLIYTGASNFERQGQEWVNFFTAHHLLNEQSNVLDIGSGIGRIAIPLTGFLKGDYQGFDVVSQGVDWCSKHISVRFTNFHFRHVELFNDLYTSSGPDAADYIFPYQSDQFDFACAISVFTHMLPQETANYFAQARRVLKTGGYLVATFYILDAESITMMDRNPGFKFPYQYGEHALMDRDVQSANLAYRREFIERLIKESGFRIETEVKGSWCGRKNTPYIAFQDILVLRKIHD
jgi:SAM-dependent methyltransferase